MKTIRRTLHPEIRVLDAAQGLAEYVASDETIDSYREVIRADGWRFSLFTKNAPFVDSHEYGSIEKLLGRVVDFQVRGRQLVETVQWAKDVAENKLAQIGWRMTEAGFLKAVSVGFWPIRWTTKGEQDFATTAKDIGLAPDAEIARIYTEQEQIELSAVIIGANPNALARAYKAEVLTDADLETISQEHAKREPAYRAADPADARWAERRAQEAFLERLLTAVTTV